MIDIHSHIIPNVDDGPTTFEESLEMLKISESDGIRKMVASPHVFSFLSKLENPSDLRQHFSDFKKKVKRSGIGIEIFLGTENYLISGLKDHLKKCPDILTINNSDYFLLEFPMNFIYPGTKDFIFEILNEGFIPVICHPERNTDIQANPSILYELLVAGALSQVDAGSIRGDFGAGPCSTSRILLKHNLVHMIGSDCHDPGMRPPGLSGIREKIRWIGNDKIELFLNHVPDAIINNKGIPDIGILRDPAESGSFFSFFRRKK